MLIQKVLEYGGRKPTGVPSRYKKTPVKYLILLREDGTPLTIQQTSGGESGKQDRGKEMVVPHVGKTSGITPNLLVDNAEYVLGWARDAANVGKTPHRNKSFVDLVRECAEVTGEPAVTSVLTFYESGASGRLTPPAGFDATANVTFEVRGPTDDIRPAMDLPSVKEFWASRGNVTKQRGTSAFECLACGTTGPVEQTLELKIKGLPESMGPGTALISFDKEAFTSYGLKQTQNAPLCKSCAEAFSQSLNRLIESPVTSLRVGGRRVEQIPDGEALTEAPPTSRRIGAVQHVFWTREESSVNIPGVIDATPSAVRQLWLVPTSGLSGAIELETNRFYSAALTANGGRAVLRDWIDVSLNVTVEALRNYITAQQIVDWDGSTGELLPLWRLANATIRTGAKNERPAATVAPALLRFALTGTPLPLSLIFDAVRRNRAEQSVRRERAALIKLTMRSRDREKGATWMQALESTNTDVAYQCGRALAVIEEIQRAAMPNVNATVVDRFYGTASSTPATVFSRLLRGVVPHFATLRRDRPGAYRALQARLEDVLVGVKPFPVMLNLEQQGMFALGYYHQRADHRRAAIEAAAKRRAEGVIPPDGDPDPELEP